MLPATSTTSAVNTDIRKQKHTILCGNLHVAACVSEDHSKDLNKDIVFKAWKPKFGLSAWFTGGLMRHWSPPCQIKIQSGISDQHDITPIHLRTMLLSLTQPNQHAAKELNAEDFLPRSLQQYNPVKSSTLSYNKCTIGEKSLGFCHRITRTARSY